MIHLPGHGERWFSGRGPGHKCSDQMLSQHCQEKTAMVTFEKHQRPLTAVVGNLPLSRPVAPQKAQTAFETQTTVDNCPRVWVLSALPQDSKRVG